jgi:hypothetical protein
MIKSKKPLQWVLLMITVWLGPNDEERPQHHVDSRHATLADCEHAGNKQLSVVDIAPGVSRYHFACVPREAVAAEKRPKAK